MAIQIDITETNLEKKLHEAIQENDPIDPKSI